MDRGDLLFFYSVIPPPNGPTGTQDGPSPAGASNVFEHPTGFHQPQIASGSPGGTTGRDGRTDLGLIEMAGGSGCVQEPNHAPSKENRGRSSSCAHRRRNSLSINAGQTVVEALAVPVEHFPDRTVVDRAACLNGRVGGFTPATRKVDWITRRIGRISHSAVPWAGSPAARRGALPCRRGPRPRRQGKKESSRRYRGRYSINLRPEGRKAPRPVRSRLLAPFVSRFARHQHHAGHCPQQIRRREAEAPPGWLRARQKLKCTQKKNSGAGRTRRSATRRSVDFTHAPSSGPLQPLPGRRGASVLAHARSASTGDTPGRPS